MSAFNGTPGPWVVGRQNNIQTAQESPLDWKGVAQYMGSGQEAEANARIIAAAPDLLDSNLKFVEAVDALYNITPAWIDDCIYDELPSSGLALAYFAARAAIAKATGGDA